MQHQHNNLVYYNTNELIQYKQNARQHSSRQIKSITKSIDQFKFINPIIVDKDKVIIAGHGRWLAAQKLGLEKIPCIEAKHLNKEEVKAYRLADNKLAENATWDDDLLRIELNALLNVDYEFDIELTGFETPEIDILLTTDPEASREDEAESPLPSYEDTVTKPGDAWQLGSHTVICGDCRDDDIVKRLMGRKRARMIITDPPYNVPIEGHARGNGKNKHDEFVMASGEMSCDEYIEFLSMAFKQLLAISCEGSLHYIFMDWRHVWEIQSAGKQVYDSLVNLCVWNKTNGGMGSFYRSQHELVFVFKKGKKPHINNIELGKHGRYRTNVWTCAGLTSFGKDREEGLAIHPTTKPVTLLKDVMLDASKHGDIVVDAFLGAGSTLIAAEAVGRRCFGIEIDPRYVDVTIERWMRMTDETPTHVESGLSFTELKNKRKISSSQLEGLSDGEK